MYKETRWAKEIIELQREDGSWGYFHTLSEPSKNPITTEQALRRLQILEYTIKDTCIEKAVEYMHDCLIGKKQMPDRREKIHDWDIFTQLMLSTWIRRFTNDDIEANYVADVWAWIISSAFRTGEYSHEDYLAAYKQVFSQRAQGGRLIDFVSFYQVSLTADRFSQEMEELVFDYIMKHENGIYYLGYNNSLCNLPVEFNSKTASRFLASIEIMTMYKHNNHKLKFVEEWIGKNRDENGTWAMGSSVKDYIYFPLSDSWKSKESRITDITYRLEKLLCLINTANEDMSGQCIVDR